MKHTEQQHLLIIDYLNNKIQQAQRDIELFSVLLDEVLSLQTKETNATLGIKFLRVVNETNKGAKDEEN